MFRLELSILLSNECNVNYNKTQIVEKAEILHNTNPSSSFRARSCP